MAPITVQDIEDILAATIKRWEYESANFHARPELMHYPLTDVHRITDAARRWRAWGNDNVVKDFVRQVALNQLKRQLDRNELEAQYLRVDVVYALMEAMSETFAAEP
ncbi:hypothetical protein DXG01_002264 [Tephrocybe rancida]|nr:hypothetical protein DXG01_002264 [Tephrocybe rancida]